MFCSNCGTEIGGGAKFCSNCGRATGGNSGNRAPATVHGRYRHGFTSFWLWGQLVLSIVLFLVFFMGDAEWVAATFNLSGFGRGVIIISMVIYAIAEILMIKWKRLGFYLWVAVPVAFIFLNPYEQGLMLNLIGAGIGVGIFFAVLRIRNKHNGKSTWEQMDNYNEPHVTPAAYTTKNTDTTPPLSLLAKNTGDSWFCKKCNEENPLAATHCKSCGEYK